MERSKVWKYFSKIKNEVPPQFAQCHKCPKKISIKGANTSGLVRHLKHIHKILIKTQCETDIFTCTSYGAKIKVEPSEPKRFTSVIQMTPTFERKHNQSLSEILSILAAKDGLTIRQITTSEFLRESLLLRGFKLPKNESDIMKLILQFYEQKKKEMIFFIRQLQQTKSARFSLTIDQWTSLRNRRYFNICIHYMDAVAFNIGLVYIPGNCKASETREIVENRLEEFGLCFKRDIVALTSNDPYVNDKFGRESPSEMVLCLNHAINSSVLATFCIKNETSEEEDDDENSEPSIYSEESDDDSLFIDHSELDSDVATNVQYTGNIDKVLQETRALVKLFRKSPLNVALQKHVKKEFGYEVNLLLDVRTRWNTMIQMVERFLKLKNAMKMTLIDLNMTSMWNDNNIGVLELLMDVLYPVKLSVEALSRRDTTILMSEAIIEVLLGKIQSMDNDLATSFLKNLKSKIKESRNVNLISLIRYLHNPKGYHSDNDLPLRHCSKTALIKFTEKLCNRLFRSTSKPVNDDVQILTPAERGPNSSTFEVQLKRAIETASIVSNAKTQLTRSLIKKEFQVFESTGKKTPILENLYKALMTVKPTSTENEQVFSLSGNFVNKIKNRLSDDAINALVFLKIYFNKNRDLLGNR